jgi:hypothetical protein
MNKKWQKVKDETIFEGWSTETPLKEMNGVCITLVLWEKV